MSKVVGVIPARFSSTRFPGKPLHLLAGKPLIRHVWERAVKARTLDQVIVATDDMRIAEAAFGFGAEVSITSPEHTTGTDRLAEVVRKLKKAEHIINIQGDEPSIDPSLIDRLVKTLQRDPDLQMITAAVPFPNPESAENPNQVKVVLDKKGNALYFSRSAIPFIRNPLSLVPFYKHQGIYGYTRRMLLSFVKWKKGVLEGAEQLEQLRALENGVRIRVLITSNDSIGIDTPEDAEAFERAFANKTL